MSTELAIYYSKFLNMEMSPKEYSTLFENLNANRIHLVLHALRNIMKRNVCSLLDLFPNDIYKNEMTKYVMVDLTKLSNAGSYSFFSLLGKKDALINNKFESRLNEDHKVIKQKYQYRIYLLPANHPLFDIFVKLPSANEEFDEVHIFVQCKSACNLFYESRSPDLNWEDHITALGDHKQKYEKLSGRKIQCCFIYIDSRRKFDDEWIKNCLKTEDYAVVIYTHKELNKLFPNLSHLFVLKNEKDLKLKK
jgi:hypothetical protein